MTIVITGGGTGGHLAIAKALKQECIREHDTVIYIGSENGQDRKWFENDSDFRATYFLNTGGVVNKKGVKKVLALFKIVNAFFYCLKLFKTHNVDCVISVGGYSAAPAAFAAVVKQCPFFIHEQNAAVGRLNSVLKKYAKIFFSSYDVASPVSAYPVNTTMFDLQRIRTQCKRVIFLGGSQGALYINDLALRLAPTLHQKGIAIIHQCGEKEYVRVKEAYATLGVDAELYGFADNMAELLSRADVAISRAGASTLWELCASAVPAFYIPYPYAAGDHQFANATFIVEKGLGWMKRQTELNDADVLEAIDSDLEEKSRGLATLIERNGAKQMIETIKKECHAT